MVPLRNPKKFIEKYGHLWYLRDFDFLPSPLEYYMYNIKDVYIKECLLMNRGKIFISEEEAVNASKRIRNDLGLVKFVYKDGSEI